MREINIFTEKEWGHIKEHNGNVKTVLDLILSLKNNSCDMCRMFYLKLWAIKVGFLVQNNGNYYVLKNGLNKAMEATL